MRVGFSLSPGGLLLPYHLGVLDVLQSNGFLKDNTPIAGSSAGAIATAAHACQLDSQTVLDATIDISDKCKAMGGARGRLLPLLRQHLESFIDEDRFAKVQARPGAVGIAYRELFPVNRPILQKEFEDRHDLMNAVCHSSTFPFFSSNWPFHVDRSKRTPRLVVDGFFTVSRNRFGCPDFKMAGVHVDRTVTISVFPKELIGLDASAREDCISPKMEGGFEAGYQLERLFRLATQASSRGELTSLYTAGIVDAENWCRTHGSYAPDSTYKAESLVLN